MDIRRVRAGDGMVERAGAGEARLELRRSFSRQTGDSGGCGGGLAGLLLADHSQGASLLQARGRRLLHLSAGCMPEESLPASGSAVGASSSPGASLGGGEVDLRFIDGGAKCGSTGDNGSVSSCQATGISGRTERGIE